MLLKPFPTLPHTRNRLLTAVGLKRREKPRLRFAVSVAISKLRVGKTKT